MKRANFLSVALLFASACNRALDGDGHDAAHDGTKGSPTLSSFDVRHRGETTRPAGSVKFEAAELAHVLRLYQEVSGRSVIRAPNVPDIKVTFENATPLTPVELLQALDNVLAAHNIVMIYLGTKYVKAVPAGSAPQEPGPVVELPPDQLPESSSYLTYIVKLKNLSADEVVGMLQPFAKMPNSIIGMKEEHILILRDYSSNVKRMLKVLEEVENAPRTPAWLPAGKPAKK